MHLFSFSKHARDGDCSAAGQQGVKINRRMHLAAAIIITFLGKVKKSDNRNFVNYIVYGKSLYTKDISLISHMCLCIPFLIIWVLQSLLRCRQTLIISHSQTRSCCNKCKLLAEKHEQNWDGNI